MMAQKLREYIDKKIFKSREILDGWKNFYFRRVTIEEVADVRLKICKVNKCKQYMTGLPYVRCGVCGCPIGKKVRSMRSGCPEGWWGCVDELQLVITPSLLEHSDFLVDQIVGPTKHYKHKRFKDIVIIYNGFNNTYTDGIITFDLWKDLAEYFKLRTGKSIN